MKITGIIILTLIFFGCKNTQKKIIVKKMEIEFISSNYKDEKEGIIDFSRISKDSAGFHLIEGEISFSKNHNTLQKISKSIIITENQIEEINSDLKNKNFREEFDNQNKIIFVQMRPKNENDLEVLSLRQTIETKIDYELTSQGMGKWIAGDLGPGGANMLFEVKEWNKSLKLIMELLNNEHLLENSLIIKRLNTAKDDWNYEVIYPIDYDGIFNQM